MRTLNSKEAVVEDTEHSPVYKLESTDDLLAFGERFSDIFSDESDGESKQSGGGVFLFVEVERAHLAGVTEYTAKAVNSVPNDVPDGTYERDFAEYRARLIIRVSRNVSGANEVRFINIDSEKTSFPFTGVSSSVESYSNGGGEVTLKFPNGIIDADTGETVKSHTLTYGEQAEFYGIRDDSGEKTVYEIVTYGEAIDSLYSYDTPTMRGTLLPNGLFATERGITSMSTKGAIEGIQPGENVMIIFSGEMLESYPLKIGGLYGAFIIP